MMTASRGENKGRGNKSIMDDMYSLMEPMIRTEIRDILFDFEMRDRFWRDFGTHIDHLFGPIWATVYHTSTNEIRTYVRNEVTELHPTWKILL